MKRFVLAVLAVACLAMVGLEFSFAFAANSIVMGSIQAELAGETGHKMKVSFELEPVGEKSFIAISTHLEELKKVISLHISNKSFNDIKTVEAKLLLKYEIQNIINNFFGYPAVENVYITDMQITK